MSLYQENLFQSRSKKKQNNIFLHLLNYFLEMLYKSNEDFFACPHSLDSNSPNSPSCLDEAM